VRVSPLNLPRSNNLIRFGAFELDLRARELRKDGRSAGLPEQSIRVLAMLLERPGELVLREEIRSRLWPNDTVVEFDHSINTAVRKLRLALGESADNPQYIETLARRGYRWIGSAEALEALPGAGLPHPPVEPDASHLFDGNLTGKKVSHYRVLEVLGGGGMGVVYKAEDLKLGRRVALKFLPDELAKDSVAFQRLEQEARAASALNHPNVCTIYEIAEHSGRPFIVMELLEGETLREQITEQTNERRRPPLDKQIDLGIQISDALAAAHARGIIHRDIKPANIFVTRTGVAKILDFGVAKLSGRVLTDEDRSGRNAPGEFRPPDGIDLASGAPSNDPSLTRTGVTMGTAGYMSPEQVRGEVLDSRTDLFSFGLVLYEMATGRAAFGAATAALMREAILNSEPAPARDLNPDIPEGLALIIRKALAKERHKRYQTAAEMRAALELLRQKATPRPLFRKGWLAIGGLALLIAATSIIWLSWRHPGAPAWPDVKLQQLTTNSWENPVTGGALSPDGRYLAYTDAKGMHLKLVGTDDSQLVPPPEALRGESVTWEIPWSGWFPDSRRFFAMSHPAAETQAAWSSLTSSIWSVAVSGGAPLKLRDTALAWSVSADGASISFGTNKGRLGERELWLMGANGEQARKILETDDARAICCMYFFQGGTRVAYVTTDDSGDTLVARDLKGGPVTPLLRPPAMRAMGDFAWLPDGRLIYTDDCNFVVRFDTPCNYWIERFDTYSGVITERARRLTKVTGAWLNSPSATADGRRVAFQQSTGYGTAYVADLDAGAAGIRNARHFTLDEGDDAITDWTPDSQTAIIVRNRGDHYALYKQPLTTGAPEPIVARADGGLIENAVLSPDAKWVILQIFPIRSPPGPGWPRKQIWRVPFGGGTLEQLFSVAPGTSFSCARAPSTVCVVGEPSTDRKQVIVSAFDPVSWSRGGELLRYNRYPNPSDDPGPLAFALSPDGRWLSTSDAPSGPLRILSVRGDPARVLPLKGLNVGTQAAWVPDGRGLIMPSDSDEGAVLLHVDLQGAVQTLFKCESAQTCFGIPSPDGHHLGIDQTRLTSNIWMLEN
jgi:serine/threonine protein kinase/Tol biopolymer transport system component